MQINHPFNTFRAPMRPIPRLFNPPSWAGVTPNTTTPDNLTCSRRVPLRSEKREAEWASLKERIEEWLRQKAAFAARNARRYDDPDEAEQDGQDE
jgi:hypothetical protein